MRAKLSLLSLSLLFLVSFCRAYAFDDWQPINPDELKMTADAAHQGDAIILYHEETAEDMTRHRYVYKRLKALTEKGKDRASVEIPYDAKYVGVSDIRARAIAPDGTITPFTGKAFNSTIVKAHGVKYLAKTFTLPNVQVGSIIEWKYTEYWEDYVFAPHWTVQDDLLTKLPQDADGELRAAGVLLETLARWSYENRVEREQGQLQKLQGIPVVGRPLHALVRRAANWWKDRQPASSSST